MVGVKQQQCPEGLNVLSEIIIPDSAGAAGLILPMLAHLSQSCEQRWITWIGPRSIRHLDFRAYSFVKNRVRLIVTQSDTETFSTMLKTLENGTSAEVVASFNGLQYGATERQRLNQAAIKGRSRALILNCPETHNPQLNLELSA